MLNFVASLVSGYLEARAVKQVSAELAAYLDRWARLIASIIITNFVTFTIGWGATTGALIAAGKDYRLALASGFAAALFLCGAITYRLWTASDLTKGIPIALPSKFMEDIQKTDVTITTRS